MSFIRDLIGRTRIYVTTASHWLSSACRFLRKLLSLNVYEGLDWDVWNSLISKTLAHHFFSLKCLLIL